MTQIYCVTHKPINLPEIAGLHTLQVGNAEKNFADFRDNDPINIAHKNPTWSENTAFFNIWKNHPSKTVGFCHYRRFLIPASLKNQIQDDMIKHSTQHLKNYASGIKLEQKQLFHHLQHAGQTYQSAFSRLLETADIILPRANALPVGGFIGQYHESHPVWPFYELLALLSKRDSKFSRQMFDFFIFHRTAHWNNLFVMRWTQFDQYCQFLFPLLFDLEKKIELPEGPYQRRVFAFLSERLFNYWVWKEGLNTVEIDWCMTEAVEQGGESHQCR